MALNIKDPEADRLVRALADATGESLDRVRAQATAPDVQSELEAIISRGRDRATLDARSADEIIGYDEHGLPR